MLELNVCIGSACHLKGSYSVLQAIQQLIEENELHDKLEIKAQFCMRNCQHGVSVSIGDEIFGVSPETSGEFFRDVVLKRIK